MDLIKWLRCQWDRALAGALVVVGFVSIALGWRGIANATLPTEQIPYLASGGLIGLLLVAVGGVLWLSADLRDEWRKLEEIHETLRHERALGAPLETAPGPDEPEPESLVSLSSSNGPAVASTNDRIGRTTLRAPR